MARIVEKSCYWFVGVLDNVDVEKVVERELYAYMPVCGVLMFVEKVFSTN